MTLLVWAIVIAACLIGIWAGAKPLRTSFEDAEAARARLEFRLKREWLEADFLSKAVRRQPELAELWEFATWNDGVTWARDRQSRQFLALVQIHFDLISRLTGTTNSEICPDATAIFIYRSGRWGSVGEWIEETKVEATRDRFQHLELPIRGTS
ncbi:hypothetical protein EP7_003855 [Isosphaeraceae bacterium EP7]